MFVIAALGCNCRISSPGNNNKDDEEGETGETVVKTKCIGCANPPAPTEEDTNIGNLTK